MLQKQTNILVKDNSSLSKGRIINCKSKVCSVGDDAKITIVKAKNKTRGAKKNRVTGMKSQLHDILVIQTKKPLLRYDGSSVAFSSNSGVAISKTKDAKMNLEFKRINTCVAFEIKKLNGQQTFRGSYNLIKLAKSLV